MISDNVQEKLVRIKGKKSFSAVINDKEECRKGDKKPIESAEKTGYELEKNGGKIK